MKTKKYILLSIICCLNSLFYAQTTTENYVRTRAYTTAGNTNNSFLDKIDYFDGLGRPQQSVQVKASPNQADLIIHQEYDGFGRESASWLPAVKSGNNGAYVTFANFKTASTATYNNTTLNTAADTKPYSETVYEQSPLNRILEQYGAGASWNTGSVTTKSPVATAYLANKGTSGELSCALFSVDGSGISTKVKKNNYYGDGELFVTKVTDEDKNISYEFKDKLGQVVLTRQMNGSQPLDTYYVYDDSRNLCFVLPPLVTEALIQYNGSWDDSNSTPFKQYAYHYKYDNRNRCVWKKIPGADPIYYVYDKADQLIFTQDGVQRPKNEWTFSISDALGRNIITGSCTTVNNATITTGRFNDWIIKANYTGNGSHFGYDIKVHKDTYSAHLSIENKKIYSVNYYDSYNFLTNTNIPIPNDGNGQYLAESGYGTAYGTHTDQTKSKGLLTGTLTAQMLPSGGVNSTYLYSVMYYDNKGRVVQTKSNNHMDGGLEKEYIAYNFTGQPTKKKHIHSATGKTTQTEVYDYTYDHAGRLKETKHNGNVIASNAYDELGRLKTNMKGNNTNLRTNYTYNIRSWITSMRSHHLHFDLVYTYGGNIKTQSWKQADQKRKYEFEYDGLSRLTAANFTGIGTEKYGANYTYDKHGNIMTLQRYGLTAANTYGLVDNLSYEYKGSNQLYSIHDAVGRLTVAGTADLQDFSKDATKAKQEYSYNLNGAMTQDLNKGITSIQYNSLNLPQRMDIKSPVAEARNEYTYSAGGQKLSVKTRWNPAYNTNPILGSAVTESLLTQSLTTDYVGNKIYENGTLKRTLIDGGYIEGGVYHYYLTDHLGNNRAVFNAGGTLIQRTQYYPFGMAFAEQTGGEKQPYKYNGKELDTKHGLNTYDYSARYMDPAIGRFTSIDPLAEKYYSWSPYAYVMNNPMKYIDPDGKAAFLIPVAIPVVEGLITLTAVTSAYVVYQLNKNAPNPGQGRWQRRQEEAAKKWAEEQLIGQKSLETGGHNPKDSGGDFEPDPNIDPSTATKIVAGATAVAVGGSQIFGENDARKDLREKGELKTNESKKVYKSSTPDNPTIQRSDATRVDIKPLIRDGKYKLDEKK